MTVGEGTVVSFSRKQRTNARSLTEGELISIYNTKIFLGGDGIHHTKTSFTRIAKGVLFWSKTVERPS